MHELGIVFEVVKVVEQVAVEQNLPAEEWDRPMDVVLTELETIPITAGYPGRLGEGK